LGEEKIALVREKKLAGKTVGIKRGLSQKEGNGTVQTKVVFPLTTRGKAQGTGCLEKKFQQKRDKPYEN